MALTIKACQELAKALLPQAAELGRLRSRLNEADLDLELWELSQRGEQIPVQQRHRLWRLQRLDAERVQELRELKEQLPGEIRPLAQQLDQRAEPLWAHVAESGLERWQDLARTRPRVLRGEGGVALARLVAVARDQPRADLALQLVRDLQADRKQGGLPYGWWDNLPGVHAANFGLVRRWAEAHPGQLPEQLKRVHYRGMIKVAKQWRDGIRYREQLQGRGIPLGEEIPEGELRLLTEDLLPPIGGYLDCCLGKRREPYLQRCASRSFAYVAVYNRDTDMPVSVAEFAPRDGKLVLQHYQGHCIRDPKLVPGHQQIMQWAETPAAWLAVVQALGIDTEQSRTIRVGRQADQWNAWPALDHGRWVSLDRFSWDFSDSVAGLLAGEVNLSSARRLAASRATPEAARQLLLELAAALETNPQAQQCAEGLRRLARAEEALLSAQAERTQAEAELPVLPAAA